MAKTKKTSHKQKLVARKWTDSVVNMKKKISSIRGLPRQNYCKRAKNSGNIISPITLPCGHPHKITV